MLNNENSFGKWKVIDSSLPKYKYLCKCRCGRIDKVYKYDLFSGKSTQCRSCQVSESMTEHGYSGTKAYEVWNDMKQRCYSEKNKFFNRYGGRGIKICQTWKEDFLSFKLWFDETYIKNMTIDRRNNNKGYSPENCRWVDVYVQNSNQEKREGTTSEYVGVSISVRQKKTVVYKQIRASLASKGKKFFEKTFKSELEASVYRAIVIIQNNLPNKTEWKRIKIE